MEQRTLWWDAEGPSICYINQALLPSRVKIARCKTVERPEAAIRDLEIRGAPALGVAGGYGMALAAALTAERSLDAFFAEMDACAEGLIATRPTAVNLAWGVGRVRDRMDEAGSIGEAQEIAGIEASLIAEEDVVLCHAIGKHGATLLPEQGTVLTHCNAGSLACVEWGTALGVIRSAIQMGKEIRVIATETRPLFQGSRLTAWELARDGIEVTVVTDSTAAFLMRSGEIDAVVVGADRICQDAVFNKVGTYMHAVCARHHQIPFYVAAPYSTFDRCSREEDITIEERGREELAVCGSRRLLSDGVPVKNPAFDATPLSLVSAIITESGVITPPYTRDPFLGG
ncbi:MAG: S-methyl-5-thioribose-1-phosphate isomerase [Methanomicrobiaceae archaeon]|nr:S-methyl-5-thioribose-1-phosphate isomerase [Methanomicrobiaceae archaeon]